MVGRVVGPGNVRGIRSRAQHPAQVRAGQWADIVPQAWPHVFAVPTGMRAVPLVRPTRTERIGLMLPARAPVSVIGQTLIDVVAQAGVAAALERLPHPAADDTGFDVRR
ncbi:hypothetical protein ABZ646_28160 [Streptomyces sp. NPDC007162]|uniref:hypothetical protein n=1 Tax=Streptomyces sp. NPDC007162 TaxID=3156917 RepID=UPI0033F96487